MTARRRDRIPCKQACHPSEVALRIHFTCCVSLSIGLRVQHPPPEPTPKPLVRKKKKVRTNLPIPNVSIAVPTFDVLRSVAVGFAMLRDLRICIPHLFSHTQNFVYCLRVLCPFLHWSWPRSLTIDAKSIVVFISLTLFSA